MKQILFKSNREKKNLVEQLIAKHKPPNSLPDLQINMDINIVKK